MSNAEVFCDLSSNQPLPDVAAYAKAGHKRIALKATEGTDYHWSDGATVGVQAHRRDLQVIWYHFARPGSPKAQAEFFCKVIAADIKPGDILCIDAEVTGVNGTLVDGWLAEVHAKNPDHELWVYGSPSFLTENHITPAHGAKLWIADYGVKTPALPHGWGAYEAWQHTDSGTATGVQGKVDLSVMHPQPATEALSDQAHNDAVNLTGHLKKRTRPLDKPGRALLAELAAEISRVYAIK